MTEFDWSTRTRLVFGAGATDQLGELATGLGARRAFLVTDPRMVAAGYTGQAERALIAAGIEVRRHDDTPENPSAVDVDACRAALGDWQADVLVGLGGGSNIDAAKGCNLVRAGGGRMEDYWGRDKAKGELLPLIAIPTTAGTGTEVQSFALIEQDETHQKMACGDPQVTPAIAILDPVLTVTQPPFVTGCTGLDALGHAIETAVTKARNAVSQQYSLDAFLRINANLPRVLADPDDLEARGAMLIGSTLAGLAIENSMLGAAHSMANPLTAHHGLAHGQAVALVLPSVIRHNMGDSEPAAGYAKLARAGELCGDDSTDADASEQLALRVEQLTTSAGVGSSLGGHGVAESTIAQLADEAAQQWTAQFNPVPVATRDFVALFRAAR